MVVQQIPTAGGWSGVQPPAPQKAESPKLKKRHTLSVVAVQSLACGVILLLALLLRAAGGESYEQLRRQFHDELMSNDLMGALAALWDGDVEVDVEAEASAPLAEGTLTSAYGYRTDPLGGGEQFHRGVDIAADEGSPIAALYDGTVTETGESDSLGRYIRLAHGDGVEILYAHCSAVLAEAGRQVAAGETVALVGSTGASTGSHLHLELTVNGVANDPGDSLPLTRYA